MKTNKSFPNTPWMQLGYGEDFSAGLIPTELDEKLVRIKAKEDSVIRLTSQPYSVINLTAGEKEYFFVPGGESITVVSGSINLMC